MGASSCYRSLTIVLATLAILSNTVTAVILSNLPHDDPFHLIRHLSVYSWFADFLSVLGLVGACKSSATLVAIFANYLLIDTMLCSIPRLLALTLFGEIRDLLCSAQNVRVLLQSEVLASTPLQPGSAQHADKVTAHMREECRDIVTVVQVLVAGLALGAIVVQVLLALRVGRYARWLERAGRDTLAARGPKGTLQGLWTWKGENGYDEEQRPREKGAASDTADG